jgi:hypothetical protein
VYAAVRWSHPVVDFSRSYYANVHHASSEADGYTFRNVSPVSGGPAVPRAMIILHRSLNLLSESLVAQEAINIALVDVPRTESFVVANLTIFYHGIDG